MTKCSKFTLFLKIRPKFAFLSKIEPKFTLLLEIGSKSVFAFCSKIGPKNSNILSMVDELKSTISLATTALRASAARSGSEGDIIAIMYRS